MHKKIIVTQKCRQAESLKSFVALDITMFHSGIILIMSGNRLELGGGMLFAYYFF
jgi:hypothetical protein